MPAIKASKTPIRNPWPKQVGLQLHRVFHRRGAEWKRGQAAEEQTNDCRLIDRCSLASSADPKLKNRND